MTITKIIAENFRCFRKVEARLAPLTLLVGENSTGKTSFLALVRALLDSGYGSRTPDFREPPYDLGTFHDIAHSRGARGSRAEEFAGEFEARLRQKPVKAHGYRVTFRESSGFPASVTHRYTSGANTVVQTSTDFVMETASGRWKGAYPFGEIGSENGHRLPPWIALQVLSDVDRRRERRTAPFRPEGGGGTEPSEKDIKSVMRVLRSFSDVLWERPYSSAPVRTRPLRTYDPLKLASDPEGENIPTYLANLALRDPDAWEQLREQLMQFGQRSGLFDEIAVRRLTKSGSGPFQIQIRKHASGKKGPWRNLIDVGYGVSQTLPFLAELCRHDGPGMLLLQQPEVHLHPQAQAELGSLLCAAAASKKQLIVETHSDHLMDRVRMDVRDGRTNLKTQDVSLLFFERGDLEVRIHSISFDRVGAVIGAPEGYRQFFMDELDRSITV